MNEALRAFLLGDPAVAAVVAGRISWGARVRGSGRPSLALNIVDGADDYAMDGPSGLVRSRVRVGCWALTHAEATLASRVVVAALSGIRQTVDGIEFQGAFAIDERDLAEDGIGADEIFYQTALEFEIWHSE